MTCTPMFTREKMANEILLLSLSSNHTSGTAVFKKSFSFGIAGGKR